ncbi:hypothetical protein GQ42DRAFT_87612 [Ramicandelaber brevisporus]|nr:hypothetical protein GQ42DRAFT_87612 [Ramicandelaber brevisporus]
MCGNTSPKLPRSYLEAASNTASNTDAGNIRRGQPTSTRFHKQHWNSISISISIWRCCGWMDEVAAGLKQPLGIIYGCNGDCDCDCDLAVCWGRRTVPNSDHGHSLVGTIASIAPPTFGMLQKEQLKCATSGTSSRDRCTSAAATGWADVCSWQAIVRIRFCLNSLAVLNKITLKADLKHWMLMNGITADVAVAKMVAAGCR